MYTSKAEIAEKNVCLVAVTYTSPKVGVTSANKLVPRKEKMEFQGFQNYLKIDLAIPDVKLVICVSIDIFSGFSFLYAFF